jgi:hypothetical protein
VENALDSAARTVEAVVMRAVHLTRNSESPLHAVYRPTAGPGAPLVIEFVPDGVSDSAVAHLAGETVIAIPDGQRRRVRFDALGRGRCLNLYR